MFNAAKDAYGLQADNVRQNDICSGDVTTVVLLLVVFDTVTVGTALGARDCIGVDLTGGMSRVELAPEGQKGKQFLWCVGH